MKTVFGRLSFKLSCFPSANPPSTVAGLGSVDLAAAVANAGGLEGVDALVTIRQALRAVAKFVHAARIGTWKNSF